MMKKFIYLTSYSIKKKLKSKSFLITNIVLFVLLLLVTNLDSIVKAFGGDFTEDYQIIVIDNTNYSFEYFETSYNNLKDSLLESSNKVEVIKSTDSVDNVQEAIKENKNILVVFDTDEEKYIKAKIISKDFISSTNYQPIVQAINNTKYQVALEQSNIDKEELNKINESTEIERILLDTKKTSDEETASQLAAVIYPIVMVPFFMIILFLIQIIGGEINEEKTTRSMEIIISNVSSKVHLFSHLVADNIFMIAQAILLGIYGFIGATIRTSIGGGIVSENLTENASGITGEVMNVINNSGILDKLSYVIPITIILALLSFFAYSFIAAVLASMSTNLEDYQQVQTPIMIICLAGFYLSIMSSLFEGSTFIKAISFVPLLSFFLSPTLLLAGQITIMDSIISIIILILFIAIVYRYGIRIYRVGILNYSSDKIWSRMVKAIKNK